MWSLAGSQAFDHSICCFGPVSRAAGSSSALGLSCSLLADPAALGLSRVALGSSTLGLWVGQLASAPGACAPTRGFRCGRPAGVSGVGPQSANLGACQLCFR